MPASDAAMCSRGVSPEWLEATRRVYSIKEIFYTLQGEGVRAGRPAVFCRFSGCNLWSGLERDRASASCRFCDTDFVGADGTFGGKYSTPLELADQIAGAWPVAAGGAPYVVLTGGEPLLQVDRPLVDELHRLGFEVAIETNGTLDVVQGIDWICVSPKAGTALRQRKGHELKLVFPQPGLLPHDLLSEGGLDFEHYLLQPMDGADGVANTEAALEYCLAHPRWRLSIQTHKILRIR